MIDLEAMKTRAEDLVAAQKLGGVDSSTIVERSVYIDEAKRTAPDLAADVLALIAEVERLQQGMADLIDVGLRATKRAGALEADVVSLRDALETSESCYSDVVSDLRAERRRHQEAAVERDDLRAEVELLRRRQLSSGIVITREEAKSIVALCKGSGYDGPVNYTDLAEDLSDAIGCEE